MLVDVEHPYSYHPLAQHGGCPPSSWIPWLAMDNVLTEGTYPLKGVIRTLWGPFWTTFWRAMLAMRALCILGIHTCQGALQGRALWPWGVVGMLYVEIPAIRVS